MPDRFWKGFGEKPVVFEVKRNRAYRQVGEFSIGGSEERADEIAREILDQLRPNLQGYGGDVTIFPTRDRIAFNNPKLLLTSTIE